MEFRVYDYNVTPKVDDRKEFSISLVDDVLIMNGSNIGDDNKVLAVKKILEDNKENIITLAMEKAENYKGGRQKSLIVKFEDDGESYRIIGNTPSHEMADFYARVVSEVTNIIR